MYLKSVFFPLSPNIIKKLTMPEESYSGGDNTAQLLKSYSFFFSVSHSPLPPHIDINLGRGIWHLPRKLWAWKKRKAAQRLTAGITIQNLFHFAVVSHVLGAITQSIWHSFIFIHSLDIYQGLNCFRCWGYKVLSLNIKIQWKEDIKNKWLFLSFSFSIISYTDSREHCYDNLA